MPALYIHIPFCIQRCTYCDFFSLAHFNAFIPYKPFPAFIARLLEDAELEKKRFSATGWDTVYIGGGTPSLLAPQDIAALGKHISESQQFPIKEFTIEANPEDITDAFLAACAEGGINRISVGIQSLEQQVLSAERRRGSPEKTQEALRKINNSFSIFPKGLSLSCDFIAGLQAQTQAMLLRDLQAVLAFNPKHISLYGLCTARPLSEEREEKIASMLYAGKAFLEKNGFFHYEISNFAKNAASESLHNKTYWKMENYAGIGPGASGTLINSDKPSGIRSCAKKNIKLWLSENNRSNVYDYEILGEKELIEEVLLMGLRLTEGIERQGFIKKFDNDITRYIPETLCIWEKRGDCIIDKKHIRLTETGINFLDIFLRQAFTELDKFFR
ncbi:coproporphyrinogen III oxidase family protein [Treponema phagedenis]|uniref:Coproporphyrinogen III oxidase family protein n=1 Tax=Treponema phagedenis TaxID=162 RepID=A0A0B7GVA4_TREPH|nr:coproporphyrinogen-III oxidase family protein [Treponema phagedenis]EFW38216.1 putative oxygen-independent coproporphyrinogen III oxidase [Treponema phagedenis F0421]NVP24609.1 coproporphyrinogen III oxidase family protein [Treponema phagedenis]QEJ94699.1 coproporphyrinogen III oxidase family protein [Treponema phagedenis]QEJ97635.1 coproporphyrinogen III oxidase family protein [Treponema phagedenis]QEK00603.1 coproporphyrinogen III oxidase family protein [Treponema phagedenis]